VKSIQPKRQGQPKQNRLPNGMTERRGISDLKTYDLNETHPTGKNLIELLAWEDRGQDP